MLWSAGRSLRPCERSRLSRRDVWQISSKPTEECRWTWVPATQQKLQDRLRVLVFVRNFRPLSLDVSLGSLEKVFQLV
jgi:hypothetical protein